MDDIVPSDILKRAMRWWWLIALFMIAGGVLGVLLVKLQKPWYESQASITTSIDFAFAGRLNEDEEDYLILTIGDVINSSPVLEEVRKQAASREIIITDDDLQTRFTKARQGYRWEITVRDHDPEIAQTLTQFWVEAADTALEELHQNTINSMMVQSAQLALQNCFSQIVIVEPSSAYCSVENIDSIRASMASSSNNEAIPALPETILLSKIRSEISDNAYLPGGAVVFNRNLSALMGVFCGLLVGLGFLFFGKTRNS